MSCVVCGASTERRRGTTGVRKTCSPECLREVRAAQAFKNNTARRSSATEKRCPGCGETKPLTVEHFAPNRRDHETGEVLRYAGWCRPCANEKARQRRASRTPEQVEADRAYHKAVYEMRKDEPAVRERRERTKRAWAQANPDKQRASWKRWYEGMKADPERHARYLESVRISYRLRRERQTGKMPAVRQATAVNAWRLTRERMPVEPFALWLDEVLDTDPRELEELAEVMDVPGRRLYDYRQRAGDHIALPSAARAVERYRRAVRIHPDRVGAELERLERLWRDAPGNGTRLTGYLRDAEPLVPLAGAVIVTVEDLWPEMAT